MAKITARGDRELKRWSGPNGAFLVLTQRGRLLHKYAAHAGYTLRIPRNATVEQAAQFAAKLGYEEA
jgi:hypothetical protein